MTEVEDALHKCNTLCSYLPCMYTDDKGCSTSDPNGAVCKEKNPNAKQICQGSHLAFIRSFLSNGDFSSSRPGTSPGTAKNN